MLKKGEHFTQNAMAQRKDLPAGVQAIWVRLPSDRNRFKEECAIGPASCHSSNLLSDEDF